MACIVSRTCIRLCVRLCATASRFLTDCALENGRAAVPDFDTGAEHGTGGTAAAPSHVCRAFGPLALLTAVGVGVMVGGLTLSARLGLGVSSVWFSLLGFHLVQLFGTMFFHLRLGPQLPLCVEEERRRA